MRGKLIVSGAMSVGHRITPADAGKTGLHCAAAKESEDHPRGCGENDDIQPEFPNVTGSPPRMRGKLNAPEVRIGDHRITPADAGKTLSPNFHCLGS